MNEEKPKGTALVRSDGAFPVATPQTYRDFYLVAETMAASGMFWRIREMACSYSVVP